MSQKSTKTLAKRPNPSRKMNSPLFRCMIVSTFAVVFSMPSRSQEASASVSSVDQPIQTQAREEADRSLADWDICRTAQRRERPMRRSQSTRASARLVRLMTCHSSKVADFCTGMGSRDNRERM